MDGGTGVASPSSEVAQAVHRHKQTAKARRAGCQEDAPIWHPANDMNSCTGHFYTPFPLTENHLRLIAIVV